MLSRISCLLLMICFLQTALLGCRFVENHHSVKQKQEKAPGTDGSGDPSETPPLKDADLEKKLPEVLVPEDATEKFNEPEESENYQLGDSWDRAPTKAFHFNHRTILRATVSTDFGLITANVIVLKILSETEVLFASVAHAFPDCGGEGAVLRTKEIQLMGSCGEIYSEVPGTDAVVFSMEFFEPDDVEKLLPVEFADFVEQGERLRFFTMGDDSLIPGYFPLYSDSDIDCLMISSGEKAIEDPDPVHPVKKGPLWSVAVSCDAMHGDSGGAFGEPCQSNGGATVDGRISQK